MGTTNSGQNSTQEIQEIAVTLQRFSASLREAQDGLEELKRMSETEVPNPFRKEGVGLNFDIIDVAVYLPKYLSKAVFNLTDLKIYTVSVRDNVIRIWIEVDPVKRFAHEIDLKREKLQLWEYMLLLMVLQNEVFQEKMKEQLNEVKTINTELAKILQFLDAYQQRGEE